LGYKTPAEKVKDWYEKDRKLFKDNFDIDSYNLAQPDTYLFYSIFSFFFYTIPHF